MKYLILVLSLLFLFSCSEPEIKEAVDSMLNTDRQLAYITSSKALSDTLYELTFSEDVTVRSAKCYEKKFSYTTLTSSKIDIMFEERLSLTKETEFFLSVEDRNGNISSFILLFTGKNCNIPTLLINEISPNGTDTQPDRIEIIALSSGNTEGVYVADGTKGNEQHGFILPSIDMERGDMIVLYWNSYIKETSYKNKSNKRTYNLMAHSATGLAGTNGVFVIYDMKAGDGEMLDALIYSDFQSTAYSGYGTARVEASANEIINNIQWIGSAVDSSKSTSTRTIARWIGAKDTNSSQDFYITTTRGQTFGEANLSKEYVEETE
ncbi:MAG: hypothetical protein K6G51_03455 [Sphaerochaetaceae bacterium]|nr:hypothetical protein [Sphaerochaetaceae bacterium]